MIFPDIIRNMIRNIREDMRKEIRIMILLKTTLGGSTAAARF